MSAGSNAGWHGLAPEARYCVNCKRKVTLKEPGGLAMRGYPVVEVAHMDCERAADEAEREKLRV